MQVVRAGELVLRMFFANRVQAERACIHPERGEQPDVAPLADELADVAAFVDGDGVAGVGGLEGGLQADGPGPEDGDARKSVPGIRSDVMSAAPRYGTK